MLWWRLDWSWQLRAVSWVLLASLSMRSALRVVSSLRGFLHRSAEETLAHSGLHFITRRFYNAIEMTGYPRILRNSRSEKGGKKLMVWKDGQRPQRR